MKIARFFAPLLFAPLLHAAVTISDPVMLRDGILTDRGAFNGFATIAQSDGSFVVAWKELANDRKEHLYIAPLASLYSALDTTRTVDVGALPFAVLQSGGPYYAALFNDATGVRRVRLYDRDLTPVLGPTAIATGADPSQLMWNGREFIVLGTPRLTFVDATGVRQAATALDAESVAPPSLVAGAASPDGSRALVVGWRPFVCFDICSTPPVTMTAYVLDDAHQTRARAVVSDAAFPAVTVAASSSGFLVLWHDMNKSAEVATIFDANGGLKGSVVLRTDVDNSVSTSQRLVAGDGDEWLVFSGGKLVQINGTAITSKTTVAFTVAGAVRFLRTGPGTYALLYTDTTDAIHGRIQLMRITTQAARGRGSRH